MIHRSLTPNEACLPTEEALKVPLVNEEGAVEYTHLLVADHPQYRLSSPGRREGLPTCKLECALVLDAYKELHNLAAARTEHCLKGDPDVTRRMNGRNLVVTGAPGVGTFSLVLLPEKQLTRS